MTLCHKPEHGIKNAYESSAVAHLTFATETGCQLFINDNRRQFRSAHIHWNVDYEPVLTVTPAK